MNDQERLKHWLRHFGVSEENVENCATIIIQGYGVSRYLDGLSDGAKAVWKDDKGMTDKDKIRAEIIRRKKDKEQGYSTGEAEAAYQDAVDDILSIIDSM